MNIGKKDWIFSVEEINEYVRRTLAMDPVLHQVKIRGEISNFKRHSSGHWYFSLKDEKSRITCVMFRQHTFNAPRFPKDGQQVLLQGNVSLFVRDGSYQFYAEKMEEQGTGELYQRFEALKAKLQQEGLFDQEKKRPLPFLPRKIALVTSATGAVLHDIYQVAMRRFPQMPMVLFPVAVQGEGAAAQIAAAIHSAGQSPMVDVIITGRGGGSIEDLWPFNEEVVARAIAASPVPVISAVGHETDVTIADFVADVRAATPSMAAELAVPLKEELMMALLGQRRALDYALERRWLALNHKLAQLGKALEGKSPVNYLKEIDHKRESLQQKLQFIFEKNITARQGEVTTLGDKLEALNPLNVLNRGYALVKKESHTVDRATKLEKEDQVTLLFSDGQAKATINQVERKENHG